VQSIKAVNGSDQCIYGSQLERSAFYSTGGHHFCQLEFSYSKEDQSNIKDLQALLRSLGLGFIFDQHQALLRELGLGFILDGQGSSPDAMARGVNEVALDNQGGIVFALFYLPSQTYSGRNSQRAFVVGADGTKVLSSFEIIYDPEGNEEEFRYLSGARESGASVIRIERNDRKKKKLITGVQYFDRDGKPVADKGCYGLQIKYDDAGDMTPLVCLDANGKPLNPGTSSQSFHANAH
jgi:hypothetical protein